MLFAFTLDSESLDEFFRRVDEYKAESKEDKDAILIQMVQEGIIKDVTVTERSKEQYVKDLSKNFKILQVNKEEDKNEG